MHACLEKLGNSATLLFSFYIDFAILGTLSPVDLISMIQLPVISAIFDRFVALIIEPTLLCDSYLVINQDCKEDVQ